MNDERLGQSVNRIGAAVARIERAYNTRGDGDAETDRRHAAMRARVEKALGELDSVIGTLER